MRRRWRWVRLVVAMAPVALVAGLAVPAQASEPLVDSKLRSVELIPGGAVRVAVQYRCPGGSDYRARAATNVTVGEEESSTSAQRPFKRAVTCDGSEHILTKTIPPPAGEAWGPGILWVRVQFIVRSASNWSEGALSAIERRSFFFGDSGRIRPASQTHIAQARVDDRGRLVIGVHYLCPQDWYVDVDDDAHWAERITAYQHRPWPALKLWEPIGNDVVCDGSSRTIVKRLNPEGRLSEGPIIVFADVILRHLGDRRPRNLESSSELTFR
jgi:hypothetical protein